jgi:hypothetical protein
MIAGLIMLASWRKLQRNFGGISKDAYAALDHDALTCMGVYLSVECKREIEILAEVIRLEPGEAICFE